MDYGSQNEIDLTEREKETLRNIEKQIYYTSHDPKNKDFFPMVMFFGIIAIIFKGAITWEIIIWGLYWGYCSSNNEKWKNLPRNVQEREYLLNFKRKLLSGELRKYHE